MPSDHPRRCAPPQTGLYRQAGFGAIEWLVATSATLHAFEPGQRFSICRVADRPPGDVPPSGKRCATCRSMLGDPEPPDSSSWSEVWERARRREPLRDALDQALDRLADAMRQGRPDQIRGARLMLDQVAAAIARNVG
jgi:hypothetical protein